MSYELCNGNSSWPSTPCPDTKDGRGLINWAATQPYPATCTYTSTEVASVFMGMLSIMFWVMVTMPQLWVNYKAKKAEGLSIFFLLQWFGGDVTNLIGCFLTKQTTSQTFLAMYYVCQDVALTSQFVYYTRIYKKKLPDEPTPSKKPHSFTLTGSYVLKAVFLIGCGVVSTSSGGFSSGGIVVLPPRGGGRVLMSSSDSSSVPEGQYYIGIAIGWLSAALYLGSRIPQLLKNWRRGSTEGLSPIMFTMAVCANITYFLGMILLDPSTDAVLCHLPWIVGSLGTVQFDLLALLQFLYFRNNSVSSDSSSSEDEGGDDEEDVLLSTNALANIEHRRHRAPVVLHHHHHGVANRHSYYGRLGIF